MINDWLTMKSQINFVVFNRDLEKKHNNNNEKMNEESKKKKIKKKKKGQ